MSIILIVALPPVPCEGFRYLMFLRTCTHTRNFLTRVGVNLAKWVGVATDASRMYTSPATPSFSSFRRTSPNMSANLKASATLGVGTSLSNPVEIKVYHY